MLHDLANDDGCVALKRFIIKDIHKNTVKIDPSPCPLLSALGPIPPSMHMSFMDGQLRTERDGERDGEREDVNNLLLFGAVSLSVCFAKLTLSLEYTQ